MRDLEEMMAERGLSVDHSTVHRSLGSILGVLPGGPAVLSSFASYELEKRLAKDPARLGKGAIEGVAEPASANNAGAQSSFIPMLTLGIPSNPVMALMIGAMMIQGIQPGQELISNQPKLFWGLIVSMWIGNVMLVVLNLPLVGLWVRMASIPYRFLFPAIVIFASIGVYSVSLSGFDVGLMVPFGLVGYAFSKFHYEPTPIFLGFVLGPSLEEYFGRR